MTKQDLREHAIAHRKNLRPEDENIDAAAAHFRTHVRPMPGQTIAIYWPMGDEFDSRFLIHDLLAEGVQVALPVAEKENRVMTFAPWDGKTDLVKGAWGAYVPPTDARLDPDIVIVPFLAFDRKGHRLGRGGGHYDATLEALRAKKDILAIGLGYAAQAVLFNLPAEPHDQPLDMVVTPLGVHDFRT